MFRQRLANRLFQKWNTRLIENCNGLKMQIAEAGNPANPMVLLLHGFPEHFYSYRYQIPALADAGYYVVAPNQRGYPGTEGADPDDISSFNMINLVTDVVSLMNNLGKSKAVIVGHDWGSPVAWNSALMRPDMFYGVGLLSVPFLPKVIGGPSIGDVMKELEPPGAVFYQSAFIAPNSEKALDANLEETLATAYYALSHQGMEEGEWSTPLGPLMWPETHGNSWAEASQKWPKFKPLPTLSPQDVQVYIDAFKAHGGLKGGLNWYRNILFNDAITQFQIGQLLHQPTVLIGGCSDPCIPMLQQGWDAAATVCPQLTKKVAIPEAGHWIQQEKPEEVNSLLLEFLAELKH